MLIFNLTFLLVLVFGLLFLFVEKIKKSAIFFPLKNIEADPSDFNLAFEDIYLDVSAQIKLNAWFIPSPKKRFTVLFFHGNGGNISHRLHKAACLNRLGLNLFLLDYQGYGKSGGKASVQAICRDAEVALDYLVKQEKISPDSIIAYGESLGSVAAISLASRRALAGLILEGAFSCGKDMAKVFFPYLPVFFIPEIFKNSQNIAKVNSPKLFIHSRADEIVPLALAKKLYQSAPGPKQFVELIGGHNTSYIDSSTAYLDSLKSFLTAIEAGKN